MKFGALPLDDAEGAVLAHTQRLPGRVIRKGAVLDAAAIAALRAAGRESVVAAVLEPGDVDEDSAAARLAAALLAPAAPGPAAAEGLGAAPGLAASRAATGRVNLHAAARGLLLVDAARIDALHAIDPALPLGTLPDAAVVEAREMVATIKVIPFAVPGAALAAAEAAARAAPALVLHPFRPHSVGLVLTTLPGLKPSVLEGTIEATEARVQALGGTLLAPRRCAHETAAIAAELAALMAQGAEILLIAGASAVVDRRDVGPEGIVRAGGEILHFGMPVDPGNLICLGRIGTRPALVLPGCARSPKLNGIDFVLSRLFAGVAVSGADIARMGVGGLLKDVDARPLPRARAPRRPRAVAALVLAAGTSRRMAPRNKLLMPAGRGKTMIQRVVDNVLASPARPVLVVTGHQAAAVQAALGGREIGFVHAEDYEQGLSASLRAGIAALPGEVEAVVVCLGDMPLVGPDLIERLIAAWDREEGRTIVVPRAEGQIGNPVLWDRRHFPEILALSGDSGARVLLRRHADEVAEVPADRGVLQDFDTLDTLSVFDDAAPAATGGPG